MALTFVRDPGFLFQPAVGAAVMAIARRGLRGAASTRNECEQYHFLDPRAEASIVPPVPSFSHARRKRLASLQVRAQVATGHARSRWPEFATTLRTLLALFLK
jgi:hypothetical protein